MDAERLCALPALQTGGRGGRRIQRQVHVRAVHLTRRLVRDSGRSHAAELPQFLSPRCTMAVLGAQARGKRLTCPTASNRNASSTKRFARLCSLVCLTDKRRCPADGSTTSAAR